MKMYSSDCKWLYLIIFVSIIIYVDEMNAEGESISTPEPEPSIGCPIPDLRLSRPKMFTVTTEPPIDTTEVYSPEDFTTGDTEYIENLESIEDLSKNIQRQTRYTDFNPYAWSDSDDGQSTKIDDHNYDEVLHSTHQMPHYKQQNIKNVRRKPRKNSSGRRRLDRHNQGHKQVKRDIKLIPSNTTIYFLNPSNNLFNLNQLYEYIKSNNVFYGLVNKSNHNYRTPRTHHRKKKSNVSEKITNEHIEEELNFELQNKNHDLDHVESFNNSENANTLNEPLKEDTGNSTRVKRKSGKTTGALRPKTGSETSSKTPSRKKEGGNIDEEGGHFIHVTEDSEDSEESEEIESSEGPHFDEVTEVRFPGEVGPLGDRRLCKIRCVKGKWVGPLCAINEEDENGQLRFQPLYKSCLVNRIQPHILLSYRNISVNVGWDLPHGHSLQARCKDLGLYKLLGETRVLCSNGLWAPRMPSCVPTTLLTNYSDDSPPSIRIKIGIGSGAFEPSGVLAVLPDSTVHLDCMYPRRRGTPEWTTTGWFRSYYIGWSNVAEEKSTKFRLTINDIETRDSGTYTCTSPRGLTNSIVIIVAMSNCPQHPDPVPPLNLRLEGLKLGQRALYTCPLGYTIEGAPNSTCLASGNWSSPTPTCQSVQCPPLFLEDPHLSLTELNASAWGRAVFKCSWGYRLSGPPGLECEPSGIWSGAVPRCKAIQCLQPLIPINGRIDGTSGLASHRRYAVGALVTFSCTEGHLLEGEASIVCTETGVWSHPAPFCKPQCVYPGDPPNGLIAPLKFHYDPGDFLSVQCRPGFIEYGSNGPPERPKCLSGGNWSGPVPQCKNYADM